MKNKNIKIESSRKEILKDEFSKEYFLNLKNTLYEEKKEWKQIFPVWKDIFNAYNSTPFNKVKVVIIWQDPYHWEWQAHGLCFSVLPWVRQPPSLKNIFKEMKNDIWLKIPKSGYLQKRTKEWVFMINAFLTVKKWEPMSHSKIWREEFTNATIKKLSENWDEIIFILWGAFAQKKEILIDTSRHHIIKSAHPSPFSANRGFFWSKPFSKTNEILKKQWKKEINWNIIEEY